MQAARKIIVLAIFCVIALLVWSLFIPYIKELQKETLTKRLDVQSATSDKDTVAVTFATSTLHVEIAANEVERKRGLGGKQFINEDRGMLFVFNNEEYHSIWMKDMYFPIDIAWLNEEFRIVDIKSNISPNTYPKSFEPDLPARYIVEVNAGYFEQHGISIGDRLSLVEVE